MWGGWVNTADEGSWGTGTEVASEKLKPGKALAQKKIRTKCRHLHRPSRCNLHMFVEVILQLATLNLKSKHGLKHLHDAIKNINEIKSIATWRDSG